MRPQLPETTQPTTNLVLLCKLEDTTIFEYYFSENKESQAIFPPLLTVMKHPRIDPKSLLNKNTKGEIHTDPLTD